MGFFRRASAKAGRAARTAFASTFFDTAVILNYHSISVPDQPSDVLSVTPANFRAHMEVVSREFRPVSVASLRRKGGKMDVGGRRMLRRRVAVTFDDGYADNLLQALPILEEFQVPATVFIVSGGIGQTGNFWWDEFEEMVFERNSLDALLASPAVAKWLPPELPIESLKGWEGKRALFNALVPQLKFAGPQAADELIVDLRARAELPSRRKQRGRSLVLQELKRLAISPMIDIGAHTVHHVCLGSSTREAQRQELVESKRWLEKELGKTIDLLAYPFGDRTDFNRDTLDLVPELGFAQAMTTIPGVVSPMTDPYVVPRMFAKNWGGREFERRLRRFFWVS